VPAGLIIYLTYYKQSEVMMRFRSSSNPLQTILKHGYFFDDVYKKITGKGVITFSDGVRRANEAVMGQVAKPAQGVVNFASHLKNLEGVFSSKLPQAIANVMVSIAQGVQKYLDVLADDLLRVIAHRTMRGAEKMKKVPSSSLQHYIAAALLGFILILLLIILTVGL
jgi:hypothetical protein